jgi:cold shock protein
MERVCELEADFGDDARGRVQDEGERAGVSEGTAREGVVKWFRSDRGYGFVALGGGSGDAFLHLKSLRAIGRDSAAPGARMSVVVEEGPRGMHVTRILDIEEPVIDSSAARSSSGAIFHRRGERELSAAVDLTGTVKWFDDVRGFGFVASDDFGRDIFVHCSVLGASGLARLDEGQAVSMRVIETPKGREAVRVSL